MELHITLVPVIQKDFPIVLGILKTLYGYIFELIISKFYYNYYNYNCNTDIYHPILNLYLHHTIPIYLTSMLHKIKTLIDIFGIHMLDLPIGIAHIKDLRTHPRVRYPFPPSTWNAASPLFVLTAGQRPYMC